MRSSSRRAQRTGAALLLVLVVLAVLSMLGAPFVASMLLRRKQSMRASAVAQLRNAAADLRNRAMAHVYATHEDEEQRSFDRDYPPSERPVPGPVSRLRGRLNQGRAPAERIETPAQPMPPQDMDDANEIAPPDLRFSAEHDNGLRILCEGRLDDEQGKVDVNRASFALLANVLGSGHLAEDVKDDDDALPLEDASMFPSDGNPRTIDGLLVVHHDRSGVFEAVTYRHKEGNELHGVVRGELLSLPMAHAAGALVADARALKIFLHRLYGDKPATFSTLTGLRRINDWPLARFFALALWHHHLDASAIPMTPFVVSRLGEQRQGPEPGVLAEAENKLLSAGLAPAQLEEAERALGVHAIVALAAQIEKEGGEKVLAELKEELARVREKTRARSGGLGPSAGRMESLAAQEGIEALTSADLERVRDLLTVHAEPVATWSPEMLVRGGFRLGALAVTEGTAEFLGPGAYVRLQASSGGGDLNLTAGDRPFVEGAYAGRSLGLAVFERGAAAGVLSDGKTFARALLRSPVNINTAPYSVIVAALKGVRPEPIATKNEDARASAPVSESQARALADAIWSGLPMDGHGELWQVFAEAAQGKTIEEEQAEALRINSVNPLSPRLRVGTCGFTFRSEETYGLSLFGVARRGPVREMARLSSFEVFTAAPGRILENVWDTQAAFAWEVSMFQEDDRPEGRRRFTLPLPGRAAYLMATYGELAEARAMPSAGAALLTSRTARLPRHVHARDRVPLVESFPELLEGEFLEGGRNLEFQQFSAEPPYAVDFFLSPLWEASGSGEIPLASVSDGTLDRPGSTVTLGYDSGTNELVLRVMGGVRPDPLEWGDAEDTFVGVRHRLPRLLARDTWYHVGFVVTSPEPGGQVLLLDGRPVGEATLSGTMQGNLAAGAGGGFSIREETAAAYLPPRGPFWVGDEIVTCASRSGQGFRIGASTEKDDGETGRGCRGTPIMAHQNATVRPVGYRVPILPALIGQDRTEFLAGRSGVTDCFTNPNGFALVRVTTATTELMPGGAALAGLLKQSKRVVGAIPDKFTALPGAGRARTVEDQLAAKWGGIAPGKMPEAVPFTYPLIMAFVFYEGAPGQAGGAAGQEAGGPSARAAAPPPPPDPGSGAGFPIDANYLPVPVDPRDAGFGERGILRIRYRFEGNALAQPAPERRAAAAQIKHAAQYDRIVEYGGIGRQAVPGDKAYPAFTGLKEISRVVYYAHGSTMRTEEFFQEVKGSGLLLKQMRVYGISIPASRDLAGLYPHSGVVQIGSAGVSRAKYPQLRDVEWIRYNHLYKNYFISGVESAEMEDSGFRTDPGTELHEAGASNLPNNKVMRGFCGSIGGTIAAWTETFDSAGISDHGGGAEIRPVYWALGALPGAGDGVMLSPRDDPGTARPYRIHKKAETDHGVLFTLQQPLDEAVRNYENPVLRRFPEPYARPGGRGRAGGEDSAAGGALTIGPSRLVPGALVALVDEVRASHGNAVWQAFSHYAVHAGRGGRASGGNVLPAGKESLPLRISGLPFLDRHERSAAGITAEAPAAFAAGEFESLFMLGAEMMHVTQGSEAAVSVSDVEAPRMFALAPADARGGQVAAAAGAMALMEPVFFTPAQLREPWPQVSLVRGTVPSGLSQGGYIVVRGFGGPEIWSFESASGTRLAGVRRGVLGSTVALLLQLGDTNRAGAAEASRDRVMPSVSVAVVRGGLCDTESDAREAARNLGSLVPTMQVTDGAVTTTRLRGQMRGQAPPNGGYVRVDDGLPETPDRIVAYMANGNLVLDEATRDPLFTGCFGTQRGRTVRGSLIDLPFRYFDRYDIGHVTPHLQHLTRAVRKPGAYWRRLSWEPGAWAEGAALRNGPPPLIRVLVRFDGEPVWQDAAARKAGAGAAKAAAGRVTILSDPVPPDGFALEVAADEIELRVLFFWPEGAYGPLGPGLFSDTWKVAPRLRSLVIEYQDRNEVLHREECVQ